jgi:AcrR family transcriptional regulator
LSESTNAQGPGAVEPSRGPGKADRTRSLILETALRLFRERGFDGTTMRAIAEEAGMSLGSTYYYFASKEHLIQPYYGRSHDEHLVACESALRDTPDLKERLRQVLRAKIETSQPYHRFAGQLFKTAADPTSPLSPFSSESMPVRQEATELMSLVVEGSNVTVPAALSEELPNLLWLYLMGIILFWIHDDSPDCTRTLKLIDRTVDIVVRLIRLSSLPPMRPLVRGALQLTRELRELSSNPSPPDPSATEEQQGGPA